MFSPRSIYPLDSHLTYRKIWRVHRLVCGKNPFEWPPLSEAEVERHRELQDARLDDENDSVTLATFVVHQLSRGERQMHMERQSDEQIRQKWFGVSSNFSSSRRYLAADHPSRAQTVLEGLKIRHVYDFANTQNCLSMVRNLNFSITAHATKGAGGSYQFLHSVKSDPLGFLCRVIDKYRWELPKEVLNSSPFRHRLLIFFAVVAARLGDCSRYLLESEWNVDPLVQHSKSILLLMCDLSFSGRVSAQARQVTDTLLCEVLDTVADADT